MIPCVFDLRLAAHKPTSNTTVVIRHYAVTHKLDRENLLMAFCHYQYVNPAEAKALMILRARGRGNANVFSFGQPPQIKQTRFFPQLSSPPEPSTSATPVRDVPVSPRASKKRKQTDTKTPTASATKQCRNTQRQQRYADENVILSSTTFFNDTNVLTALLSRRCMTPRGQTPSFTSAEPQPNCVRTLALSTVHPHAHTLMSRVHIQLRHVYI